MTCAIELRCHTRYMAYGPIAFGVRMEGDAATHQAVNGLLDRALEVVLVRRDAPGVRFLTKTDPGGLFLPDPVAPPPLPGMSATARVIEEREFDLLDHGRRHDGAATYFAFACFADAISACAWDGASGASGGASPGGNCVRPCTTSIARASLIASAKQANATYVAAPSCRRPWSSRSNSRSSITRAVALMPRSGGGATGSGRNSPPGSVLVRNRTPGASR
ncbi:MAG: hypothetical protein E6Q93_24320, partial [Burkholderiaceae bacterium]